MRAIVMWCAVGLCLAGPGLLGSPALAAPDSGVDSGVDGGVSDAGAPADGGVAAPAAGSGVAPAAADSPSAASDAAIARSLTAAFSTIERLSAVDVSVFAGVVTLDGTVKTAKAREAAEALAGKLDGVLYVQNRLGLDDSGGEDDGASRTEADEAIAIQLRAIYENADDLQDVDVAVARGVVQLGGSAPSDKAIDSAEKVAQKLAGVVHVSNRIALDVGDVGDRVGPLMSKLREQGKHVIELLPVLGIALVVFILFYLLARVLRAWDRPWKLVTGNALARMIFRQIVFAAVLVVGLLLALEITGATAVVGAVLGTAGVLGLALGFALQDIVQNYISGIMLSLRQPFEPRDFVQIGDHQGIVIRLTMRETFLMTLDGNHLRIPNADVFGAIMTNFSRNPERRFDFGVGVGTNEDLVIAQQTGLDILSSIDGVLADPKPFARVENLGDSSVTVRFYAWVNQKESDFGKTKSVAIRKVKVAFDEAEIEMPEPIYRVSMTQVGAAPPEETVRQREQKAARLRPESAAAIDDTSRETTIEDKVDEERAVDKDDLLSKNPPAR